MEKEKLIEKCDPQPMTISLSSEFMENIDKIWKEIVSIREELKRHEKWIDRVEDELYGFDS